MSIIRQIPRLLESRLPHLGNFRPMMQRRTIPFPLIHTPSLRFAHSVTLKLKSGSTNKTVKFGLLFLFAGGLATATFFKNRPFEISSKPNPIDDFLTNFEALSKAEKWEEIISSGTLALKAAKKARRPEDEAQIYAQLTSTSFYMGNYSEALLYARNCRRLSEENLDQPLLIKSLYLESAAYRALAPKEQREPRQQEYFRRAVAIAQEAVEIYRKENPDSNYLLGKVYLNLGAAHADNPKGDLKKAINCYTSASECFKSAGSKNDLVRTNLRMGKIHLLQKNYPLAQEIINTARKENLNQRLAMHTDYLEAQVKVATNELKEAKLIAEHGLALAIELGAKEEHIRFLLMLATLEEN